MPGASQYHPGAPRSEHTNLPKPMGQQQLLLLVLGIVIVGLAVVVGIQAFSENQEKANQDAIVNDGIRIASDAQAWALKPSAFGGGEGQFNGLSLDILGYDTGTNSYYSNINGEFSLAVTNGASGATGSILITACNADDENETTINVAGFDQEDITTNTNPSSVTCP